MFCNRKWIEINIYMKLKYLILVLLAMLLSAGCASFPNRGAAVFPGWKRVNEAAVDAALAPQTWAPLAGAMVLRMGNLDNKLADWAYENTPVFGSPANAERYGDYLAAGLYAANAVSSLATPAPLKLRTKILNKLNLIAIKVAACELADGVEELQNIAGVIRPDFSAFYKSPWGPVTQSGISAARASRNLDYLRISKTGKTTINTGLTAMYLGMAWSRIESGQSSPFRVLTSMALGNFIGSFINNAFFGPESRKSISMTIDPIEKIFMIGINFSF
jgi:hypothetical protein